MKKLRAAMMLLAVFALLAVGCAGGPQAAGPASSEPVKIALIHFNDLHGHALAYPDHGVNDVSGLPAIATLVAQTRAEYKNTLVLDAGDFDTGRPESDFFKAEPMIVGYNMIGVDASIVGNHEFDNDNAVFEQQKALANFPILSANVKYKDGKYFGDAPYIVKNVGGVKVGIFGLTTLETITIGTPAYMKNVDFIDEVQAAKDMVSILRNKEKCDVVIALTHLGVYSDNKAGSRRLAAQVPGIDLIVDGHSHTQLAAPVMEKNPEGKDVPIVQSYMWGLNVGKGILTVQNKKLVGFDWQALTVNDKKATKNADGTTTVAPLGPQFDNDPAILAKLSEYQKKVDQIMGSTIGVTTSGLFTNADKAARKVETALGDIVADSFKWSLRDMSPDFGFVCGGTIRTDLPAKELLLKDVYAVLPFDNTMYLVTLKGSDVQAMFDYIATIKQGNGAFPQVSDGVTFTINYDKKTCENILIGGKPIDPNKEYKIATDSYHATGGDGYNVFKNASKAYDSSVWMRDAFVAYLKQLSQPVGPVDAKRFNIIGSNPL